MKSHKITDRSITSKIETLIVIIIFNLWCDAHVGIFECISQFQVDLIAALEFTKKLISLSFHSTQQTSIKLHSAYYGVFYPIPSHSISIPFHRVEFCFILAKFLLLCLFIFDLSHFLQCIFYDFYT